ncbi:MAG: HEAT repeat domain-containing protein [bacterium]|nr:HEAT repeat domain-containing protein [bacterium]
MSDEQRDALLQKLQSEDQSAREDALRGLGSSTFQGDTQVMVVLITALRTREAGPRSYRLRQFAAESLGSVGDRTAVQPLTYALEDEHTAVRVAAAAALGKLGDSTAVSALEAALRDKSPEVRGAAIQALTAIDATQNTLLIPLLADPDDAVRERVREALAAQGANALKPLVDALQDTNSTIRGAAAELLGKLADERAREALDYTVKRDKSEWVKGRAKWALEQLPPPVFVPPQFKRGVAPPPPTDTLQKFREQQADLPTLERLRGQPARPAMPMMPTIPPAGPQAPSASTPDPKTMTAEQVEAMLDQLDVRLANGEISQATYERLAERWEARLKELRGE